MKKKNMKLRNNNYQKINHLEKLMVKLIQKNFSKI